MIGLTPIIFYYQYSCCPLISIFVKIKNMNKLVGLLSILSFSFLYSQDIPPTAPPPSVPLSQQRTDPEMVIHTKVDQKAKIKEKNYWVFFDYSVYDGEKRPTDNNFKLSFISEIDGSISRIEIKSPIDVNTKGELMRCMKNFAIRKSFEPAILNGQKVRSLVKYIVVFDFQNSSYKFIEE